MARSPPGSDARRSARQRTLLGATLVHGAERLTVECAIRNQSAAGMRVTTPPETFLPDRFWLQPHGAPVAHEVRLLWRREREIGLEIIATVELQDATDPDLRLLRRIWIEKAPRSGAT